MICPMRIMKVSHVEFIAQLSLILINFHIQTTMNNRKVIFDSDRANYVCSFKCTVICGSDSFQLSWDNWVRKTI